MALNENFTGRGLEFRTKEPLPSIGLKGFQVIGIVGTAPDKSAAITHSKPFRISTPTLAQQLDTTNDELGTAWRATARILKKVGVAIQVIVVPEGDDEAETISNIIGGVDGTTGQRTGIAALMEIKEVPDIILAPGYSHNQSVADALKVVGNKINARVFIDGPNSTNAAAKTFSLLFAGSEYDCVYCVDTQASEYSAAAAANVFVPGSVDAAAAYAARNPWESPSNSFISSGDLSRVVEYTGVAGGDESNDLLKHGISHFVHPTSGGTKLIGNRALSGVFISWVGLIHTIIRKLNAALEANLDANLTRGFIESQIEQINNFLQRLRTDDALIDAIVELDAEKNGYGDYVNGKWYINIRYGRYSPNEHPVVTLIADNSIVQRFVEEIVNG